MERPDGQLATALAKLESRWGSAAIRLGNGDRITAGAIRSTAPTVASGVTAGTTRGSSGTAGVPVEGALAPVLAPVAAPSPAPHPLAPLADDVVSTGFAALDEALGPGGLPREVSATIRGDASCGKTTLALRCIAEAQARGAIVAFLDLARIFDPLEAVSRGVDLRWLVVLHPVDPPEGFALAGALLSGRSVDLLVVDLPARLPATHEAVLRRLTAHARRVGARLIVLEPMTLSRPLHGALSEATSVRFELDRRAWIRLGRDVVGQRTEVTIAKNRFGPPGRRVELEIRYADEGDRAAALRRLLDDRSAEDRLAGLRPLPLMNDGRRLLRREPRKALAID